MSLYDRNWWLRDDYKAFATVGGDKRKVTWDENGGRASITVPMAEAANWDEFSPKVQQLALSLAEDGAKDTQTVSFGLHKFATRGVEFTINGRPAHLRGNHDGGGRTGNLSASGARHVASDAFNPTVEASSQQLAGFLFDTRIMKKLGAKGPRPLLDGDPNSFWQAGPGHPQAVAIEFKDSVPITGVVLMPRQNHRDHEGDVREYSIEPSDDGTTWRVIKSGTPGSSFSPVRIDFGKEEKDSQLRFTSRSGFGDDQVSALAELAVIYTGPAIGGSGNIEYKRVRSASENVDEGTDVPAKQ